MSLISERDMKVGDGCFQRFDIKKACGVDEYNYFHKSGNHAVCLVTLLKIGCPKHNELGRFFLVVH